MELKRLFFDACYEVKYTFYLTRAVIDNFIIVSWLSLGKICMK